VKYITTEAGTTAKKTVPTNRNRKLEKLVIRLLGVCCVGTVTEWLLGSKGIKAPIRRRFMRSERAGSRVDSSGAQKLPDG
jgi:hypothetical protein